MRQPKMLALQQPMQARNRSGVAAGAKAASPRAIPRRRALAAQRGLQPSCRLAPAGALGVQLRSPSEQARPAVDAAVGARTAVRRISA